MDSEPGGWLDLAARHDFGLVNANYAGALFAISALACWSLYFFSKKAFWPCLLGSLIFTFFMMLTQSRGALVGLGLGGALLLPWISGWRHRGVLIGTHALVLIFGIVWMTGTGERIGKGWSGNDGSVSNRLALWKPAPAMMAQAPRGWGLGNSADAFHQWYQSSGSVYSYKHLVNSHLTWMVELGWIGRFFYLLLWTAILLLCLPSGRLPGLAVALAVWVAFGATSFFSGVAQQWYQWVVPGLTLGSVLWVRTRKKAWPSPWTWPGAMAFSFLFLLGLYAYGRSCVTLDLEGSPEGLRIGHRGGTLLILRPAEEVVGKKYGHRVREALTAAEDMSIWISREVPDETSAGAVIVLSGKFGVGEADFTRRARPAGLILINPAIEKETTDGLPDVPAVVIWGGLRQRNDELFWKEWADSRPRRTFQRVEGSAEYIPSWFSEVKRAYRTLTLSPQP